MSAPDTSSVSGADADPLGPEKAIGQTESANEQLPGADSPGAEPTEPATDAGASVDPDAVATSSAPEGATSEVLEGVQHSIDTAKSSAGDALGAERAGR